MSQTNIRELIASIARQQVPIAVEDCIVSAVDWEGRTCDCQPDAGPLLLDVRLRCERGEGSTGLYGKPKIGARCLVALVDGSVADGYLLACDSFEEWVLAPDGSTEVRITPAGIEIARAGQSLGPILQDLLAAISQLTVSTAVGPSGPPINVTDFIKIQSRLNQIFN